MNYAVRKFEAETGNVLERRLGGSARQTQVWGTGLQIWDMKSWCGEREIRVGLKSQIRATGSCRGQNKE